MKNERKKIFEAVKAKRNLISLQSENADNVVNTIQWGMACHGQKDKQKQKEKIENVEENDWQARVKMSDDHSAYLAKTLDMFSEFQHMW